MPRKTNAAASENGDLKAGILDSIQQGWGEAEQLRRKEENRAAERIREEEKRKIKKAWKEGRDEISSSLKELSKLCDEQIQLGKIADHWVEILSASEECLARARIRNFRERVHINLSKVKKFRGQRIPQNEIPKVDLSEADFLFAEKRREIVKTFTMKVAKFAATYGWIKAPSPSA